VLTSLAELQSITTINTADAEIVLKLVKDFTPTITGMLKHLQNKKAIFQELGMVPFILSQVQSLYGGVTKLIGTLDKVVPVCNPPFIVKLCATDQCILLPGQLPRRGERSPSQHGTRIPKDNLAIFFKVALLLI
jgi:hypothetical protein